MHYRMLVTIEADQGIQPGNIAKTVEDSLYLRDDFIGETCDFFEIGGRWDGYLGCLHNAIRITEEVYSAYLARFEGHKEVEDDNRCMHYMDLNNEPLTTQVIGTKWLVVVDCHI